VGFVNFGMGLGIKSNQGSKSLSPKVLTSFKKFFLISENFFEKKRTFDFRSKSKY